MTTKTVSHPVHLSNNGLLLLLACGGTLIHILLNGQYGFHRDELDIIMNARQLDWGYVAYPPVTPFIARIGLELFGNSLQGLRLFSALGQGLVMVLAGLMARDMGGKRGAQAMAAIAADYTVVDRQIAAVTCVNAVVIVACQKAM